MREDEAFCQRAVVRKSDSNVDPVGVGFGEGRVEDVLDERL